MNAIVRIFDRKLAILNWLILIPDAVNRGASFDRLFNGRAKICDFCSKKMGPLAGNKTTIEEDNSRMFQQKTGSVHDRERSG